MDSALLIHRLHFAFTATFHYLFPQLTMGLALLIVVLKTLALRTSNEIYNQSARFWAKIFGINFILGVVTGIPMEFQFGTNWSHFARVTGGVIGQPLVMEGVFSSSLNPHSWDFFCLAKNASAPKDTGGPPSWYFSDRGSPDISSSLPTPGCNILSPSSGRPTAAFR